MKKMARALLFLLSSEKEGISILILEVPPGKRICIATIQASQSYESGLGSKNINFEDVLYS